jgi:antitoxin VapB
MNLPEKEESSMPISIRDAETVSRIRDLAALTGETITVAVRIAIEQRLRRESSRRRAGVANRLLNLSLAKTGKKQLAGDANDAIGYDEFGLPK